MAARIEEVRGRSTLVRFDRHKCIHSRHCVLDLPDGPLKLEGSLEIVTGTGRTILRTSETCLCRCGASGNKPYCDGSHTRIGFKSS